MATTQTRKPGTRKSSRSAAPKKAAPKKAAAKKAGTITKKRKVTSFDRFKTFGDKQYTGVQIGRGHHWHYDQGDWKETKITPDLWEISYAVTKRRTGHAPEGSGVPVGTAYHWYILAHQSAVKLDANDYATTMTGLKFKIAHKRADKNKWSASGPTQRKHLIAFLKKFIAQLESDVIPIEFELDGKSYKGEAVPISETCANGVCYEAEVTLNDEAIGIIRCAKSGWKMDLVKDRKLIDAIGNCITLWFE
ncbi:hypothetical protein [Chitinophaga polysaccharea]|uniref:hypothetical protein n=1 Tax=Chitinophaga polysaccharea TaxID=1293035 RepID=UPI001C8DFA07|nr:hypothetical protein [Chitinophaga polysaccharea]